LPEALLAKSVLDSEGIECFLADENTIRMDWLWSNAMGGIRLCVKDVDADAARQLLEQAPVDGFEAEGTGEYRQPRCPKCQSSEVSFRGLQKQVAYGSLFLGLPAPIRHHGWKCNSCGLEWDEEDTPQQIP
jgi:rubredoxin